MLRALKREILEETNLTLKKIRWALVQESIHSKEFYRKGEHFLLLNFYADSSSRKFRLNDEAEAAIWIDPQIALKLRLNEPTRILLKHYLKYRS